MFSKLVSDIPTIVLGIYGGIELLSVTNEVEMQGV